MRALLIGLAVLGWSGNGLAATVGKVGGGGEVLFVRLTPDEAKALAVGAFVSVTSELGELTGMVLSKKGGRARIKLDQAAPEDWVAPFEVSLVPTDPEVTGTTAAAAAPQVAPTVLPAGAGISLVRSPFGPYTTFLDTSGSKNSDGSGVDIFETFNTVVSHTSIQYLFLWQQIQIGPQLGYFSSSNTITNNSTKAADGASVNKDPVTISYTFTEFGIVSKYLFFPYQAYQFNPMGMLGFSLGNFERKIGEKDPQVAEVQTLRLGFGAQYFVTSGVSLEAAFEYRTDNVTFTEQGTDSEGDEINENLAHAITTMGINYGLSIYF